MRTAIKALAALTLAASIAAPASAALMDVTYTGVVAAGNDTSGVFTAPGTNLANFAFTAHYLFDTTLGSITSSPTDNTAYGGDLYSLTSPALSASLTINGTTVAFTGQYSGQIENSNTGTFGSTYHFAQEQGTAGSIIHNRTLMTYMSGSPGSGFPAAIDVPFTTTSAGNFSSGSFDISDFDLSIEASVTSANGSLAPDTVTVTFSEAPEPTTITLLAAGLLALGAARRKRA